MADIVVDLTDEVDPPPTNPPKKRKSAKKAQMERDFEIYLQTLSPADQEHVRIQLVRVLNAKENILVLRQELKTDFKPQEVDPANSDGIESRTKDFVDSALLTIDEWASQIMRGQIEVDKLQNMAESAVRIAEGRRSRIENLRRELALRKLQSASIERNRELMLNDPSYIQARSQSFVTPDSNSNKMRYSPSVNPSNFNYMPMNQGQGQGQGQMPNAFPNRLPNTLPNGYPPQPPQPQSQIHSQTQPVFQRGSPYEFNNSNSRMPFTPSLDRSSYYTPDEADIDYEKLLDLAKNEAEPLDMPPAMDCVPLDHQREGLGWLLRAELGINKGSILADDMGLGKTVQSIALMYANPPKPDSKAKQTLIVCPLAMMETWKCELHDRVKPEYRYKVYIHHRSSGKVIDKPHVLRRSADVIICTYGAVLSEYKNMVKRAESKKHGCTVLFDMEFHRIILDEAHQIKNKASVASQAVSVLKANHRLALTGTPMQNRLSELYPLVRFLHIEPYWKSDRKFKKILPSTADGAVGFDSNKAFIVFLTAVMLRRKKDTIINGKKIVDNLPEKHIETVNVDMETEEREEYESVERVISQKASQELSSSSGRSYAVMFELLMRLRQTSLHPLLIQITSLANTGAFWKNNATTRQELATAMNLEPEICDENLKLSDYDRFCVCCGASQPFIECNMTNTCGHIYCLECRNERKLGDFSEDLRQCDLCSRPFTTVINFEAVKIVRENRRLTNVETLVRILLGIQKKRMDIEKQDNEDRRKQLEELKRRALAETVISFSDDEDDEFEEDDDEDVKVETGGTPKKTAGSTSLVKKKNKDPLEYVLNIDKVAQLSKLSSVFKTGWVTSSKIEQCLDIMRDIMRSAPSDKIILFTSFTSFIDIMTIPLTAAQVPFLQYTGKMSVDERTSALNQFQNGNSKVLLVSLRAGNAGLTLIAANRVIIAEPFWNPYIEDQASDRVYRIGQSREVTIYKILMTGTVEDRIHDLQEKKREIIEGALDPDNKVKTKGLTRADLIFALGMGSRERKPENPPIYEPPIY